MTTTTYTHACDASGAVLLPDGRHFVAASDEDNFLRVYDLVHAGAPVTSIDVTAFLEPKNADDEADIEGVARVGSRLYWIGSHGRNKSGKEKELRRRLFATTIADVNGAATLVPVGRPYKDLLRDLTTATSLSELDLSTAATRAPEAEGGLNIEGLAATPEGTLLIGFRNPVPAGRALIVELANPDRLVDGHADEAELSIRGRLDLQGRGIRALEFVAELNIYLVLAGPFNDAGTFALYAWSGVMSDAARLIDVDMTGLQPEELIVRSDDAGRFLVHLLSDDGTDQCKDAPLGAKSFRMREMTLPLIRAAGGQ